VKGIKSRQNFKVLSDEQVDTIHEASLSILERTGIRLDSEEARKRLLDAGAANHGTRRGALTFDREMVESAIKRLPRRCVYYARNPKYDLEYDGDHMYPYAGGGDPKMIDMETGQVRPSVLHDVEMAARLGDALENNHFAASLVVANDVPPDMLIPKTMEATMKNSVKPVSMYAPDKQTVDILVDMWSCVSGGIEEFRKRPLMSLASSPSSPLTYGRHNCDVIIRSAELGVPYSVVPCPICGETGPITLSGALAQQNAETLAGIMLIQTVTTELPTVYCGRVCFMDPRSGRDLWGVPEEALTSVAMVQLARKYGMVSDTCGMSSDVPRWGVQMGLERMMTALVPAMAGAESLAGMGGAWEAASSLEMMVIDDEILNDVSRIMNGIGVDDASLALEQLDRVGHMGNFLAQRHTMEFLRKGELRMSPLWDKRTTERAKKDGYMPTQDAARQRVMEILKDHVPDPLDRDTERMIADVIKDAGKRRP
jgi:trimethylamine--corrinoid protein Co-methyltransferase